MFVNKVVANNPNDSAAIAEDYEHLLNKVSEVHTNFPDNLAARFVRALIPSVENFTAFKIMIIFWKERQLLAVVWMITIMSCQIIDIC